MKPVLPLLAAGLAILATAPPAHAQSAFDTDWACWYQGAGKLNCLLLKASSGGVAAPAPVAGKPLPDSVTLIWQGGSELYSQIVEIPLLNDPQDMVLVSQLAQVSVCGDVLACRMTFVTSEEELALLQQEVAGQP